ncbi:MAG: hypothetical protein LBF91_04865 [Azoarcus sp.]|nr:hypothetical protein [Azoarcus sp.]
MARTFSAYSVYWYDTTVTPPVGHGMAGRIVDTGSAIGAQPSMRTGLNGDPRIEGFTDAANNLRIAVTDRVANTQRPVYIHDATTGAEVSGKSPQSWLEGNLYTLVKLNGYLYAIDYDNAKVIEINASTYAATGVTYSLAISNPGLIPSGYQAIGQALIVANNALYGLFAFPDSTWSTYANSLLVRFDISGSGTSRAITVVESNSYIEKNAFSIAYANSNFYIASIGGKQNPSGSGSYNPNSKIQSIPVSFSSTTSPTTEMSPSGTFPYEFRDISFSSTKAYILAGAYDSNWQLEGKLISVDASTFTNPTLIDGFPATPGPDATAVGYLWSAQYTLDSNRVWFARGNAIRVYDASNNALVATLTVTAGSLIAQGDLYTNINDLTYVGAAASVSLRGYRSPLQRANTPFAHAARALTRGRPELTEEERQQILRS